MINKQQIKFFIFIIVISTIGQMSAEVYVPSLPYIGKDFSAPDALVQLSISYFLLGMAIFGIFFGYASDFIGRQKILLISSLFSALGTLICAISPNIYWLIIGRLFQGVGFSGISNMGSAILRDNFHGVEYAKYLSYLGIAFALSIDLAPFIGGFMQEWFGWRSIFILIFIYNLLVIYMGYRYKEKLILKEYKHGLHDFIKKIALVCKNKNFVTYSLVSAIIYSIFMAYIAVATFLVQGAIGKSPIWFGTMTLCLSCLYAVFSFLNGKLLNMVSIHNMVKLGYILVTLSAFILILISLFKLNIIGFLLAILPMFIGSAFIFANSSALSFNTIHENIGVASAVGGASRLLFGFIVTATLSRFHTASTLPLGISFAILSFLAFGVIYLGRNR
jgi:MFS transporter, DHA1 family, 2-module integral membrane pump EmrD